MQTSQTLNLVRGDTLSVRNSLTTGVQPRRGDAKGSGRVLYRMALDRSSKRRPRMVMAVGLPPQKVHYTDRSTGEKWRHHLHETV